VGVWTGLSGFRIGPVGGHLSISEVDTKIRLSCHDYQVADDHHYAPIIFFTDDDMVKGSPIKVMILLYTPWLELTVYL
jgi:hypothetical protein